MIWSPRISTRAGGRAAKVPAVSATRAPIAAGSPPFSRRLIRRSPGAVVTVTAAWLARGGGASARVTAAGPYASATNRRAASRSPRASAAVARSRVTACANASGGRGLAGRVQSRDAGEVLCGGCLVAACPGGLGQLSIERRQRSSGGWRPCCRARWRPPTRPRLIAGRRCPFRCPTGRRAPIRSPPTAGGWRSARLVRPARARPGPPGVQRSRSGSCGRRSRRRHRFFNYYTTLLITPMFIFSGVFYPVATLPAIAQVVVNILPLSHAIALIRPLVAGQPLTEPALHLAVLFAYAVAGYVAASFFIRRRLISRRPALPATVSGSGGCGACCSRSRRRRR